VVSHAGSYLLVELADRVGLTSALSQELVRLQRRRRARDAGEVLRDLAVSIADGSECLSDLSAVHHQSDLFGEVTSVPTAWWSTSTAAPAAELALGCDPVRTVRAIARAPGRLTPTSSHIAADVVGDRFEDPDRASVTR
jgi:hypothetical protein